MKIELLKKRKIAYLLLAFFLPVVIMTATAVMTGLAPFGSRTLLISDIGNQFVAFYSYFKNIFASSNDFTYTLSKCLGGDMVGFSAYYLHNPFLLILFLFDDAHIAVVIFWMLVIQMGFMGLTFYLLMEDEGVNGAGGLIFSTAYALMGYALSYLSLPIYFSNLILLPLIMLGLNRCLADSKRRIVYVISLAAAIWCNYYLGYMTCIFVALYVLTLWAAGKITSFKKILDIAVTSLLGVGLAAFSLIPTVISIAGTKEGISGNTFAGFKIEYSPRELIRNLLPGTFYANLSNYCAPYIYVGVVVLIFMIFFIIGKRYSIREKIAFVALLIIMVASSMFSITDVIWHAFNAPVGFAHRFAFLICFLMILLGAKGYAGVVSEDAVGSVRHRMFPVAVLVILCAELTYNSVTTVSTYLEKDCGSQEEYENYLTRVEPIIDTIKTNDPSLYRIEKDFMRNPNDSMQFSYASLTHNSSCEKGYVKTFIGRMGFRNQGIWAFYNQGSTALADCLLGVRYFVSRFDSTDKPYNQCAMVGEDYIYQNPYALPMAFMATEDIFSVDMTQEDLFAIQNDIASATYGEEIYSRINDVEVIKDNLSEEAVRIENTNESGTNSDTTEDATTYRIIDSEKKGSITYKVKTDKDANVYCYFSAPYEQKCELYKNEEDLGDYFSDFRWSIVNLGNIKSGKEVSVTLELSGEELSIYNVYFYEEDVDALTKWAQNELANRIETKQISSSEYAMKVNASEDSVLVMDYAYEPDWTVYVDDKKVEQVQALEALMAISIEEGSHTIKLVYEPRGRILGMVISVVCLLILLVVNYNYKKNKKIGKNMLT